LCMEKKGIFKGFLLGFNQLNNCMPDAHKDYEPCRIGERNKILNDTDLE
jgi:hypothetical protein